MPSNEQKQKRPLYNPLKSDFVTTYDINEDGHPLIFVVPSKEVAWFEEPVYSHAEKHLVDFVINERDLNPLLPETREAVKQEVEVTI